eukprot:CAMPEP_0197185110 /NCGR_PEP_ID=MMETSP1423-20130617/11181_1 /TAXON_ID=476441 /ORGANISM="Pseudo-nitzschia heimii, Strain UNC1101" /LENGTH=1333 /DNA_ID=CAMNT_0042636077 /DNA_START=94 /DNA_END=4092 /DNA_ORIENTATION=+
MNREHEDGLYPTKSEKEDDEIENRDRKRNQESNNNEQNHRRENLSDDDSCDIDVNVDGQDGYLTDRHLERDDNSQLRKYQDPGHDDVDNLPFYNFFCYRLEKLWKRKQEKQAHKRWKEKERLEYVLPRKMLNDLNGQTIFPYLRLLIPEQDSRRQFRVKEKKIADAYCKAQGFGKGTKNYEALMNFTDPQKVPSDIAGDLSLVVEYVLKKRLPENVHSDVTLGKINCILDEIANLRAYSNKNINKGTPHHNHDWRKALQQRSTVIGKKNDNEEMQSDASLRANWLRRVMSNRLSPLEHKWLVRILQKKMEIGVGYVTILKHISPYATELWNAHNNLQRICTILSDPTYTHRRNRIGQLRKKTAQARDSSWQPQVQPAELGNTLSPMISTRSSFEKLMTQTQANHEAHLKKFYHPSTKTHKPLSLQFPALTAEIKLDGERMIIHINNGRVRMNTRNSKWFSELYGPVLGPSLRRSLSKYTNLNVILDGEIESWDNANKSLIPFGENRTVAGYRRAFLKHHGMIDPIDTEKLHDENDTTVMRLASDYYRDSSLSREETINRGKRFWLKFRAFDILYVNGSDKHRLYKDCGIDTNEIDENGSIINLPLLKRKQILYQILLEQENEIEICPTVVIRCNGDVLSGNDYFSTNNLVTEFGYPAFILDSTQAILQHKISGLEDLDNKRRLGRTNLQISKLRAEAVEKFYSTVVEEYKFEGLVIKDLASPYLFGMRKFWWKFKPDYETNEAVDIDVVIIGAKFATGLRNGGTPSGYLVGVVDKFDQNCFLTLNSVNAASTTREKTEAILKHTGFKKGEDGPMELGKWFREDDFGLPSFVSKRSLQRNCSEDLEGWTFNKTKRYPDIWIDPKDSVVLTVKCAEIVVSEEYSVGLSMRFPRIKKIRLDGDEKKASEIATDDEVWNIFNEARSKRLSLHSMTGTQSQSEVVSMRSRRGCRFLTSEEFRKKTQKRKQKIVNPPARKVPKVEICESNVLEGLSFCVLEGVYLLDASWFDVRKAQEGGWEPEVLKVKSEEDVIEFIKKHGGTYTAKVMGVPNEYIIGGNKDDARVKMQIIGLKRAKSLVDSKKKADKSLASVARYHDGIVKWTYVYSLVHRLQEETKKTFSEGSKDSCFVPEPHEYLARISNTESVEEAIFSLNRPILVDEMEHVLATPIVKDSSRWQFKGMSDLPKEDRWALSSNFTFLWPYSNDEYENEIFNDSDTVVVYPDVFSSGFGFSSERDSSDESTSDTTSPRWNHVESNADEITSILPLISSMGGLITPHLHSGVTHVVCLLKCNIAMPIEAAKSLDLFVSKERGRLLIDCLDNRFPQKKEVTLISPNW